MERVVEVYGSGFVHPQEPWNSMDVHFSELCPPLDMTQEIQEMAK